MAVSEVFADGVRPKWSPGLNAVGIPKFTSVASWLATGTYGWLPSAQGSGCLDLRGSVTDFTSALASEIARFSCAAYESLLDAGPPAAAARSLGWTLVRHYYATFYCAHALLRIAGTSLTYLSASVVTDLNKVAGQYLGVSPQLVSGLYLVGVDSVNRNLVNLKLISGGKGGSHEEMWGHFLQLLADVENSIVLSQGQIPSALQAVQIFTQLRTSLCSQGKNNGAWPSSIRNAVNYRHDYGVWYPYSRSAKQAEDLVKRMKNWSQLDGPGVVIWSATDDLSKFVDICNVVTHFMTSALNDIAKRATTSGKSFVDRYPFKLLRLRQIAP